MAIDNGFPLFFRNTVAKIFRCAVVKRVENRKVILTKLESSMRLTLSARMSGFDNLILMSGTLLSERTSSCELTSSANLDYAEGLLSAVTALCKDKVNRCQARKFLLCLFLVVVELLVALTLQHSLLDYVLAMHAS